MHLLSCLLGMGVGVTLGLTGAGGGIIALPLLTLFLGLSLTQAAPVALVAVGLAAAVAALIGLREGVVRYKAALVIGGTGALVTPLGLWIAHRLPSSVLSMTLIVVLLLSARNMYSRSVAASRIAGLASVNIPCRTNASTGRFVWTRWCASVMAAIGATSGLFSGMLGVGGGFVIVPALSRYSDLAMRSVVSTSQAVIALVSAGGCISAVHSGSLDWRIALPFALSATAMLLLTRLLATGLPTSTIQRSFACLSGAIAVLMAVRLLISTFSG